jgi:hypothetical protein
MSIIRRMVYAITDVVRIKKNEKVGKRWDDYKKMYDP